MNFKERFIKKWPKTREKGKLRYIFLHGVVLYNVIYYFAFIILYKRRIDSIKKLILIILIFSTLGAYLGYSKWKMNEKAYNKHYKNY